MNRRGRWLLGLGCAMAVLAAYVFYPPAKRSIEFPAGHRFALSIVDDTDLATLDRLRPVYEVLAQAGLRTTKTIWTLEASAEPVATNQGATLRDPAYRDFILDLQAKGFEIALHGVRGGSSPRADILAGLEEFKQTLGVYPRLHVNHALNRDNLYWGANRWGFAPYRWGFGLARPYPFSGDDPASPNFWGDAAREHVSYVRRFTFSGINLLRVNPAMPYRLADTPYVNYWFDGADGGSIDAFDELLKSENLDRLEQEGGVCIVYAHLGAGSFNSRDGGVDPRFIARIQDVSSRNGWFAPVTEILDYLATQPGWSPELSFRERVRLETLFLLDRVF